MQQIQFKKTNDRKVLVKGQRIVKRNNIIYDIVFFKYEMDEWNKKHKTNIE